MSPEPIGASARPAARRRRISPWLVMAILVLLVIALSLRWVSQPSRVAGLLLDRVGDAMGLEITASGVSEYRLRGTPMIVVRDLVASQPGATDAVLQADRVYLSLPWTTLRQRGADLTVQRVELDGPQLDLAALQRWRATRPKAEETRVPTLTEGVEIVRGRIIGSGWSIDALAISLPSLHPDAPVTAAVSGRVRNGDTRMPFDLRVALTSPSFAAGLGAAGRATPITARWRMPMQLTLSSLLHDSDDGGFDLDRFKLGANARYIANGTPRPLIYGLGGTLRYGKGRLTIAPLGVALRGRDVIPTFDAQGMFALQEGIALRLAGTLAAWPESWPALPAPIARSNSPLPFVLDYSGRTDLSGETALRLRRDATRFDGRFRLPEVLAWIDGTDTDGKVLNGVASNGMASNTPLPPLDGTLHAPRLEIAGAVLEGVEVEFDNGDESVQ